MDNRNEIDLAEWVDGEMAGMKPLANWEPDSERALARLQELKRRTAIQQRRRTLLFVAVSASLAVIMLLPSTRAAMSRIWNNPSYEQPAANLKEAPDFDLEDIAGGRVAAAALKGKVTVIDFFATWCLPCLREVPDFNALHQTYEGRDVAIVAIVVESPYGDIAPTVKEHGMRYKALVGNDEVVAGFGGLVGFPTTFVLTPDWKIHAKYLGVTRNKKENIQKDIEALLAQAK
jgi:thiol-disulfide isomerase/thioredoxin